MEMHVNPNDLEITLSLVLDLHPKRSCTHLMTCLGG